MPIDPCGFPETRALVVHTLAVPHRRSRRHTHGGVAEEVDEPVEVAQIVAALECVWGNGRHEIRYHRQESESIVGVDEALQLPGCLHEPQGRDGAGDWRDVEASAGAD